MNSAVFFLLGLYALRSPPTIRCAASCSTIYVKRTLRSMAVPGGR